MNDWRLSCSDCKMSKVLRNHKASVEDDARREVEHFLYSGCRGSISSTLIPCGGCGTQCNHLGQCLDRIAKRPPVETFAETLAKANAAINMVGTGWPRKSKPTPAPVRPAPVRPAPVLWDRDRQMAAPGISVEEMKATGMSVAEANAAIEYVVREGLMNGMSVARAVEALS